MEDQPVGVIGEDPEEQKPKPTQAEPDMVIMGEGALHPVIMEAAAAAELVQMEEPVQLLPEATGVMVNSSPSPVRISIMPEVAGVPDREAPEARAVAELEDTVQTAPEHTESLAPMTMAAAAADQMTDIILEQSGDQE
jgi:hypothetical protein